MTTYTIPCLSESMSPMTHMSGTAGNVGVISREPVATERGLAWLPCLSGNALRHRCVREPGMLWLIDEYDLKGKLSLAQLNFLLHGGNLTESTAHENTRRIAEMKRTWPLLRLVGGSLPNQILAGSLDAWRGVLVCEENRVSLREWLPAGRLYSAERFIAEWQYTRGDARKLGIEAQSAGPEALPPDTGPSNLMIYSGQAVQRGAMWVHGFVVKHVSEIELGALLWSLRLWQDAGGTVGGMAARGHGRLRCEIVVDGFNQEAACERYVEYARSMKDDAIAWLADAWS